LASNLQPAFWARGGIAGAGAVTSRPGLLTDQGKARQGKARQGKVFFSEEKKQKTFATRAGGKIQAMAGNVGCAA
jgi:hypothetical protein